MHVPPSMCVCVQLSGCRHELVHSARRSLAADRNVHCCWRCKQGLSQPPPPRRLYERRVQRNEFISLLLCNFSLHSVIPRCVRIFSWCRFNFINVAANVVLLCYSFTIFFMKLVLFSFVSNNFFTLSANLKRIFDGSLKLLKLVASKKHYVASHIRNGTPIKLLLLANESNAVAFEV